jgi:hypothetical protein
MVCLNVARCTARIAPGLDPPALLIRGGLGRDTAGEPTRCIAPVSSSGPRDAADAGGSRFVHMEPPEDLVTQASTQSTNGLGLRRKRAVAPLVVRVPPSATVRFEFDGASAPADSRSYRAGGVQWHAAAHPGHGLPTRDTGRYGREQGDGRARAARRRSPRNARRGQVGATSRPQSTTREAVIGETPQTFATSRIVVQPRHSRLTSEARLDLAEGFRRPLTARERERNRVQQCQSALGRCGAGPWQMGGSRAEHGPRQRKDVESGFCCRCYRHRRHPIGHPHDGRHRSRCRGFVQHRLARPEQRPDIVPHYSRDARPGSRRRTGVGVSPQPPCAPTSRSADDAAGCDRSRLQ